MIEAVMLVALGVAAWRLNLQKHEQRTSDELAEELTSLRHELRRLEVNHQHNEERKRSLKALVLTHVSTKDTC
jgi:hypothetical protein